MGRGMGGAVQVKMHDLANTAGGGVERVERLREGDQGQKRAEDVEKEAKQEGGHGKEKTTDVWGKRVEN